MKIFFLIVFVFSGVAGLVAQKTNKAVFIIADGIPADVIEKVKTPALDEIAAIGGYARAHVGGEKGDYTQTPTISAVGYNSLLTGTWVNKHNVWDNDIKSPNYNYWNIFRFLKNSDPGKQTAIFSTWLDNRTKLLGDDLAEAGAIHIDHHVDGLEKDTLNFPHDSLSEYIHRIDELVADSAAAYIQSHGPDLTWVYLEYTDDMGHKFGDSEKFYRAVQYMDSQVGRIWTAIRRREKESNENWVIYITTDHGRDAKTGRGHGGQSDRERNTWIVTNAKGLNEYFRKYQPGIIDIMPTLASFLHVNIPREQRMEMDGVPLTGSLSAISPRAVYENGTIRVSWKALQKTGMAKIWVSATNNFKTGGKDAYRLAAQVPLLKESASFDVGKTGASFYKVVIETPGNFLNRWVVVE
jgi:predicted AlkP superfamily pyrophosphatase or phosphodiesterase